MHHFAAIPLALLCAGLSGHAQAASMAEWESCSAIPADIDRLACYDQASGRAQPEAVSAPGAAAAAQTQPEPPVVVALPAPDEP